MERSAYMPGWLKSLSAVLALAISLAGCAVAPRYQSVKHYVAPEDVAAKACLSKCGTDMESCKRDCQSRHQSCVKGVLPDAQARYDQLLRHYEGALSLYRWDLERYRMDLMFGSGYGHPYGAWGWYPPFPPPIPPVAPSLEHEVRKLTQERCDRDCGCQTTYDSCFLGCGGRIENQTQCIAHCPEVKP